MQSFRVMKFGGTSVAGADRMRGVADLVAAAAAAERVGVVASAVSGVTDLLVGGLKHAAAAEVDQADEAVARFRAVHEEIAGKLAPDLGAARSVALAQRLVEIVCELAETLRGVALLGDCSARVEARTIVLGERASCALLCELFASRGLDTDLLDPLELLPCTGDPLAATPQPAEMHRRLATRREAGSRVLLLPGFFGGDEGGQVMCLGRGGSDYSAALLAQALEARLLEIWTDVDGVFTTDPRLAPAATCLERMSYEEAMELAHFGAKVLHPRTIAPARVAGIPVRIRNSFHVDHPGTLVERRTAPPEAAERVACGISFTRGVALVSLFGPGMEGVPGVAARLFAALASRGISVMLITQGSSETAISFCVDAVAADEAERAVRAAFESEIDTGRVDEVVARRDLAIVSLVGDGMRERVGVAGRFFGALGVAGVNVAAIAQGASERSISAVIAAEDGARAVAAVHERLFERPWPGDAPPRFPQPVAAVRAPSGAPRASEWVTAYAPAGIGNFAAGFDLLGAAIAPVDGALWGDCVAVRRAAGRAAGEGDRLECRGGFAHRLPAEARQNLVLKARDAFAQRLGEPLPALDFVLHKNLPVASGLGSSASSVAATLVALNELLGRPLDDRALLAAAGEAEAQASGGVHLDNVAPALLGGLRLVDPEAGSRALPFPQDAALRPLGAGARARDALRAERPAARAPAAGRHRLGAESGGADSRPARRRPRACCAVALRDSLAEPHRAALVPGFRDVQRAALAAGALGCTLSGAGPAVFAVVEPRRPRRLRRPASPPGARPAWPPKRGSAGSTSRAPASGRAGAPGCREGRRALSRCSSPAPATPLCAPRSWRRPCATRPATAASTFRSARRARPFADVDGAARAAVPARARRRSSAGCSRPSSTRAEVGVDGRARRSTFPVVLPRDRARHSPCSSSSTARRSRSRTSACASWRRCSLAWPAADAADDARRAGIPAGAHRAHRDQRRHRRRGGERLPSPPRVRASSCSIRRGRISPLQERQIATLGDNVRAFAVEGSFDDCQRLVKSAFADPELARSAGLVSANSIHLARLLAQVHLLLRGRGPGGSGRRRPSPGRRGAVGQLRQSLRRPAGAAAWERRSRRWSRRRTPTARCRTSSMGSRSRRARASRRCRTRWTSGRRTTGSGSSACSRRRRRRCARDCAGGAPTIAATARRARRARGAGLPRRSARRGGLRRPAADAPPRRARALSRHRPPGEVRGHARLRRAAAAGARGGRRCARCSPEPLAPDDAALRAALLDLADRTRS